MGVLASTLSALVLIGSELIRKLLVGLVLAVSGCTVTSARPHTTSTAPTTTRPAIAMHRHHPPPTHRPTTTRPPTTRPPATTRRPHPQPTRPPATRPPATTRPHPRPTAPPPPPSAPSRGTVWLTFDDGPNPGETQAILGILAQHRIRATFFVVGKRAQRYPNLVAEERAAGMTIGNHTYDHPLTLINMTRAQMAWEIDNGVASRWFRPPGGFVNQTLREVVASRGKTIVLWDVDPQDWSRPGANVIAARVLSRAKPWWSHPSNPNVVIV